MIEQTKCSECGKYRSSDDCNKAVSVLSHDRLEQWWEPVCRWCVPALYVDAAVGGDVEEKGKRYPHPNPEQVLKDFNIEGTDEMGVVGEDNDGD